MAKLEISSEKGASTFTILHSPGLMITFSFRNNSNDLFKKLKQHSCKLNMPSNLNIFLFLILDLHYHEFWTLTYISQIYALLFLQLLGL